MNKPYAKGKKKNGGEEGGHSPYEPYKPAPSGPYVPAPRLAKGVKNRRTNNVNT
tara:strand:+ start:26 stop:187 length:162 start_codon:yes stop_codon:yes gene_type:complete